MKTILRSSTIFFLMLTMFISGCGPAGPVFSSDPAVPAQPTHTLPALEEASATPQPTAEAATATTTLTPTQAPTPTVYPPVFNPDVLGDNTELLDSFILTRTQSTTDSTGVYTLQQTIGYIKQPFSLYELFKSSEGYSWGTYFIGDRVYDNNGRDLKVYLLQSPEDMGAWVTLADMRQGNIMTYSLVIDAQFSSQEEYKGIPAYHFTLDQTNLRPPSDPSAGFHVEQAQGDVYLAQDGNYLLYFHLKLIGHSYLLPGDPGYSQEIDEMTEELSSINQLAPITLPADYSVPDLDLGTLPLPPDSNLVQLIRYEGSSSCVDSNYYSTLLNNDSFLEFYQDLPPTDGWTVTHIGQVNNHHPCSNSDHVCVIIKKGNVQFVVFYDQGGIKVSFDRCNWYAPK